MVTPPKRSRRPRVPGWVREITDIKETEDMLSSTELYLINALVIAACILIGFFMTISLRNKYQKQAIDHVLGEFVTREGTGYPKLLRVEGGLVVLEPDEKKGIKGKAFPIAERVSYLVDYPEGPWCPRFLKCKIKKMVFREFDLEPVSNLYSNILVPSPETFYNLLMQKVTEIGARIAQEGAEGAGIKVDKKKTKLPLSKFWLFIIGIAVVGGFIYLISTLMQMKAALGM